MTNNTYKWIIGCLAGVIIILIAYLILSDNNYIFISFSDALSLTATISSIILSIVAMLYTYYSGRDAEEIYNKINSSIDNIDIKILSISAQTDNNSKTLEHVVDEIKNISDSLIISSNAIKVIKNENATDDEKRIAINTMEDSNNAMLMFLQRMSSKKDSI